MKPLALASALGLAFASGAVVAGEVPRAADSSPLVIKVYSVEDLVFTPRQQAERKAEGSRAQKAANPARLRPNFDALINLLQATVAPGTWEPRNAGGGERQPGMTPYFLNASLIVRQTPTVHDQIANRLHQLRRLPGLDQRHDDEPE